jgi:hypothetical protein
MLDVIGARTPSDTFSSGNIGAGNKLSRVVREVWRIHQHGRWM